MRVLSLVAVLAALALLGCDDDDIHDHPIDTIDAAGGTPDAPPVPGIDADPDQPDAPPGTPDAPSGDRAQVFCDRYESLCGYDPAMATRFDDEAACLSAFAGFDSAQRDCVEGQLDEFEVDGMTQHCARATGTGPCG